MKRKRFTKCIYYLLSKLEIYKYIWIKIKNVISKIMKPFILKQRFNFRSYRKREICPSMTLVIDLDETLIYCTKHRMYNYQKEVDVLINGKYISLYVCKRPYVDLFFSSLYPLFEIIVFTTSLKSYADTMLNIVDIEHYIDRKFYRENCYEMDQYFYIKNLVNIKKEISKIVLLDDSNVSGLSYPNNFFPIKKWRGDLNDTELLDIIPFFMNLRKVKDIRSVCSLRLKKQKEISKLITSAYLKEDIQSLPDDIHSFYGDSIAYHAINYLKIFMHKFRYVRSKQQWNELGQKINSKWRSYPFTLSKLKGYRQEEPPKRKKRKYANNTNSTNSTNSTKELE